MLQIHQRSSAYLGIWQREQEGQGFARTSGRGEHDILALSTEMLKGWKFFAPTAGRKGNQQKIGKQNWQPPRSIQIR